MEMNVCNANTNWLRGEQDCTKGSQKDDKKRRKNNRERKCGKLAGVNNQCVVKSGFVCHEKML